MGRYRISMDFNTFDFRAFKEEYKSGVVKFYVKYNSYKNIVNELMNTKDNIAYIYAFNIPKFSGRFVMRTKIIKTEKCNKNFNNEIYDIAINLIVDKVYNSKSPFELTPYKMNKILGKKMFFLGTIARIKEQSIIDYLDGKTEDKEKLMISKKVDDFLKEYVTNDCYLKNTIINNTTINNHKTFIEDNGTEYIEWHHIIFRSKIKDEELKKQLDINCNLVGICPRCHRMIHHGDNETKKQMVNGILNRLKEDNEYDLLVKLFHDIKNHLIDYNNEISLEEYLYKIYNIK